MKRGPWERRNTDSRAYNKVHIVKYFVESPKQIHLLPPRTSNFENRGRECSLVGPKYVGIKALIKAINISVVLGGKNIGPQLPINFNGFGQIQRQFNCLGTALPQISNAVFELSPDMIGNQKTSKIGCHTNPQTLNRGWHQI